MQDSVQKIKVGVKKWPHFKGELPAYQSALASGFDVRAQIDQAVDLHPGERQLVSTGLSFEIPPGFEIQARPRSGWALRHGVGLVNSPGTIDADFRGEVKIILINLGKETVTIQDQERIAQLVLCPVYHVELVEAEALNASQRGEGGFGSTGRGEKVRGSQIDGNL
jgi:dUTP pyrophosphatase